MGWTDIAGVVLVLVVLVAIIRIMVTGPSTREEGAPKGRVRTFLGATFLQGLLAGVGLGTGLIEAGQGAVNPWLTGVVAGAGAALLFVALSRLSGFADVGIALFSGLFGAIGIIVTVSEYFDAPAACSPADVGQRVLGLLVVAVALVLGGMVAWFRGFFSLTKLGATVLAVFGALEVTDFLSSPLGVALVDLGVTAWLIALVAAFALGFAASIWPELVITVAAIAVVAGSIVGTVSGSANALCLPGPDIAGLAPLLGYVGVYVVGRLVLGRAASTSSTKETTPS
jgi:hypothetical protein